MISGTIGAVQHDIKKIIAYSTCSQLGYMVLACGISAYNVGFFHLFNHAFFKALLFLLAGSVIHVLSGEQDIRKMGALGAVVPFVYVSIVIASVALAGLPFFSGFYSKDLIIEISVTRFWVGGQVVYWFGLVSALLTSYYSFYLVYKVFLDYYNGFKYLIAHKASVTVVENTVFGVLVVLSVYSGFLFKDLFVGHGGYFFGNQGLMLPLVSRTGLEVEFFSHLIKLSTVVLSVAAMLVYWLVIQTSQNIVRQHSLIEATKWYFNEIMNSYIGLSVFTASRHVYEQYDKYYLEFYGPLFFVSAIKRLVRY